MTGEDVREVFEAILPQQDIEARCAPCGVIERQRTLHRGMVVRALVMAAGTPGGAYQAAILRSYLEFAVPRVARAAFYRWFDEPLEQCMGAWADRALAAARAQQVDLTGILGGGKDWYSVASTTVRVRDALRDECPGAGDAAALKGHKVLAGGCGASVYYHFSPAREHDSRHLTVDESWRGCGRLADLADASLARVRACNDHGVRCVIRLKDHWQPTVDHLARGPVSQAFCPGTDLDARLAQDIVILDGQAIEADVQVGGTTPPLHLRLIGVHTPTGDGFCLTNLPPRLGPRQVAALYRVRWEVELRIRLDKSVHRGAQVDAARPCSVQTLLHASRIASSIAALLAPTHHRHTCPSQAGAPRTAAPLHPRRLALPLAVSCQSMAQAFA